MNQDHKDPGHDRPADRHGDGRHRVFLIAVILVLLGAVPFIRAREPAEATEEKRNKAMTKLLPFEAFYAAEDYHRKYRLRSERDLMRAFRAMYPSAPDFMNSAAAARVNGYLDGYGSLEDLLEELPGLGLSPAAGKRLAEIVKGRKGRTACRS